MTLGPSLSSLVVTLGSRGALNRALEGPIFRPVSGLGSLEQGIVNAGMIGCGCLCVPGTDTEALGGLYSPLVFVFGDFGLEGGSKQGAGCPPFLGL